VFLIIVDGSQDIRRRRERLVKHADIARQMVGSPHVTVNLDDYVVNLHNSGIFVFSNYDALHVRRSDQLDLALDLAHRYEEEFGGEYVVRKKY
tara:strand:+ start:218 stop:496 length:279 start_codon:yes stop_codon:yes gene_type:complete